MSTDVEAGAPNTVTERIDFRDKSIDRALPTLLSDNGKMTVMVWEQFCDKVDKELKPLGRIKAFNGLLWCVAIVGFILMGTASQYAQQYSDVVYGVVSPVVCVCLFLGCWIEGHIRNKVSGKIANICASTSNHDRDLTLKLNSDTADVKYWFIGVTLRNIEVADSMTMEGKPVADMTPMAVATPVEEPVATPAATAPAAEAPKKYIRDPQGNLTLNPEYKAWMKSNYG